MPNPLALLARFARERGATLRLEGQADLSDRVVFVPRGPANGVRLCTGTIVAVTGVELIPNRRVRELANR